MSGLRTLKYVMVELRVKIDDVDNVLIFTLKSRMYMGKLRIQRKIKNCWMQCYLLQEQYYSGISNVLHPE